MRSVSALETYLTAARDTRGIEHMNAIKTLRWYIRTSTEHDLIVAIRTMTDINLLKYIIEAGVNATLQHEVTKRYEKLTKAAEGGE
jgi:hypothetical protein